MAEPTLLTGVNGVVSVGGSPVAVANFDITIARGVAAQPRVGKFSDRKVPGKVDITGTLTRLDPDPANVEKLIGGTPVDSSSEVLHASADLTGSGVIEPVVVSSDPTNPSKIQVTVTRGDADTTASYIIVEGTDVNDNPLTNQVEVPAITVANSPVTVFTEDSFKTTDNFIAGAGLNVGSASFTEVALEAITGTRTTGISDGVLFTLNGKAEDQNGQKVEFVLANAFFTEATMAFSDADTIIDGPFSFTMQDPDEDFTYVRSN